MVHYWIVNVNYCNAVKEGMKCRVLGLAGYRRLRTGVPTATHLRRSLSTCCSLRLDLLPLFDIRAAVAADDGKHSRSRLQVATPRTEQYSGKPILCEPLAT